MEPTNLYLRILLQQNEPCDHDECRKLVAKLKQENTQLRAVIADNTRKLETKMEKKTKQIQVLAQENTRFAQFLSDAYADNKDMTDAYVERCGQLEVYKRKSEDLKKKCDQLRHALDGVSLVV